MSLEDGEGVNLVSDLNIPEAKRPRIEPELHEEPEVELPELQLLPEVEQQPEADPRQVYQAKQIMLELSFIL